MQQESIDSIIVLLRIRPFNEKERQEEALPCFKIDDHSKNTVIFDGASKGEARYFTFDHVCPEQIHQEEIFRIVGIPTARSCLQGYNGCIFAYGQTGAGKTYTIQGQGLDINVNESLPLEVKEEIGLLPRVVDYMFSDIASAHDTSSNIVYSVKCNYLEIYNEHIIDLLNPSVKNLQVREDLKRGVHVEGITEELCSNASQTMDLLLRGNRNRHIGSTNLNIESSRSHSVFTFSVEGKVTQDGITRIRTSQFSFVDLAGSERQKVVGTAGERLKEGCLINKSLMVLANVINSLVDISEGKSRFVHYRDSKLTFLLKYSLGGNAKTSVIANISPASTSYIETLSTLKFAQRAKLIKNKVRVNEDTSGTLESLKNEIFRLRQELATMRNIFHIGGIKYDDYKRDPNRLGFESDQGSVSNRFMYESLDNQETRETRETQKSNELERLLKQSLDLLRESETHLLSELGKKEDVIDKLQSEQEETGKHECQMKMVIKLLYDKVERYKAILAKKMITAKDCIDVINEEHRNDLRKKVVQVLNEPQTDLQKSQMKELDETREENIRIKQEYKRLIELLTQKDDEIAKLNASNESRIFNRSKSPSKSPLKKAQSVKIGTNKGVKGGEGRIKDEYDELVKEYMNVCEKLEDREQDVQQMRQDFENLEAEKKEMIDNLSKELAQIKKDYHKKLEKIVKEKERRLDFIKEDFASLNNDKDQLQQIVNTVTEEKENLSKKVDELKARINQSNQDKLSGMSRFEENRQKELENLSNQVFDLQEKLRVVIEENKDVKNENRKIVEEYESACKEVKADYDRIKEEERRVKTELQEMQAVFDDLQQQYLEKKEENQELATRVEKLERDLDAKEQLIPTLKGNVDGISREVSEKNREIKSIQNECERLKNENLSNEQEFKKLQKDHDRLTCQYSYLKQEEAALQEELQIVQHKLDCEIQESHHLRNEYENLNNVYKTKEHDNGGYQRKLREKDEEIETIKDEYEKEIQALRKLYDSMKKDSLSKSQEAQRIQHEYEISQRNLLEQLQELQMLRSTIDDSKEKVLTSQQDLGRTRNEYNILQEDYFAQGREAKNLREEVEELRVRRVHDSQRIEDLTRECKSLQQKLAKEAEEIRTLEEDCRIYKNQKSGINQELSALAKQYQEMHNDSTAKQQEIEDLKDQILEMREKWIVAQETRDLLARDCQHWESKYELKEEDFAKLKIEAEGLKRSIMEQDDGYEDLRRQIEVLQLEATKTKSICESLRAENERSLTEIEKISSVVVKQEEELEELRRERNRLKNERNRLSGELQEYQQDEVRMKEQVDLRMRTVGQLERRSCSPEKDRRANQGSRRVISQLDSVLEELGIKDRKIKSLEGKLKSLKEGLVEKNEEIKIKEMIIRDKDEDCLMKEQEKLRLKEEYQILLNEKNLMDAAEKSLRGEVVKLSEEIFKVTNNRKEAKAEMKRAQKELDQENKRLTSLLRKQDEEMVNLRKEFQRLEDEIQTLTISKAEWMEKAKMNEIEQLNQENFDNLRSQYIRLSEKFESCERQLTTKEVEIKQLKQDCNTLIDERDTLQDKVKNYKANEVKLKKEIKEYSDNVSRLQEGQAKELQEIKDHYSRLNTDHKTIMRSIDSKDAQVLKLKEELDLIVTEKTKLLDEVKEYKNMTHRDIYASVEKRSKSKNERESYSIRVEDLTQRNGGALSDRDYSPIINRFSSRQRDESDSRYNSIRKPNESNEKERLHFRGSYSNQKDLESYRVEAEKKNADNSGILKAFPRYSATSFLTPQRDRSSLNASRDMDGSFNGLQSSAHVLGRQRGTHNREDIDSNAVQNSIFEKEALLTRQKIYLGHSVNSSLVENEHQRSLYESKSRSLLPTPTKNTGNNESFQKYSDSKYNYTSGKSPNLKKTDQPPAHEDHIKDSTLDSYRRLTQISEKSSPNKRA